MGLSFLLLGAAFKFQLFSGGLVLVFTLLYIAFFAMTLGPIVWVVIAEIFPTRVRGRAMAIATAVALDRRLRRLADLPGDRRQAPRVVRLLALRGDVRHQPRLHLALPAGDERQEPRGDREVLAQKGRIIRGTVYVTPELFIGAA